MHSLARDAVVEMRCQRLIDEVRGNDQVEAVLLVGSRARGLASASSDLDLAVLTTTPGGSRNETRYDADGSMIGIEYHEIAPLLALPRSPFLDPKELCDAARLALGQVLYARSDAVQWVQSRLSSALPHPQEAARLLAVASQSLQMAQCTSGMHALRALQGAMLALCQLRVSFTPPRYQKPKWLMHDLDASEDHLLRRAARRILLSGSISAHTVLERVEEKVRVAMELARRPFQQRTPGEAYKDFYIRHTFKDASALLERSDDKGSRLTALVTLRLVAARLQDKDVREIVTAAEACVWEESALRSIFPATAFSRRWLKESAQVTASCRKHMGIVASTHFARAIDSD